MARPESSYMTEAPPGYRWKTVTKINAMGRPYTTRILVPIMEQEVMEPQGSLPAPQQVVQPQTAAGLFEDSGYDETVTNQFPGGYPGQATTPQPPTPPNWRDSFVGRAPPRAKKKDITTVIKKSEDPGVATTETITIKGGLMGESPEESFQATPPPQPPSWDGSAAFADRDVGMGAGRVQLGDPRNVRAGPDLPPGYAPNPAYAPPGSSPSMGANYPPQKMSREGAMAALQEPNVINGQQVNPQDHVGVGSIASRLGLSSRLAKMQERNRAGYQGQKDLAKKGAIIAGAGTAAQLGLMGGQEPEEMQRFTPSREQRFPQEVLDRERISVPQGGRSGPLPEEVIAAGQARQQDAQTPFPNRFPQEALERNKMPKIPFRGEGEASSQVAMPPLQQTPFRGEGEASSAVSMSGTTTKAQDNVKLANNPNLEKIWGKFAYDPAARKKYFIDGMKEIYKKAMLLNLIAVMTGGESQAEAYIAAKTGELKLIDKFDEEERVTNIWKEVFTDENGQPYMPKSKREAAERAGRTGARPEVIKDIFGAVPEAKAKQQYHRVDPKDPTKWEHKRFPAGEEPTEEWVSGKAGSKSPEADEIASIKALNFLKELEDKDSPYADEYANIINARRAGKSIATGTGVTFFNKMIGEDGMYKPPEGKDEFSILQDFLSLPEVTLIREKDDGTFVEVVVPGWSAITGQTPSKIEIDEVTAGADKSKGTDRLDGETREQFEARVRKRYPNASDAAVAAAVEKEYG